MEQPEDWSIVVSVMPWLCLVTIVSVVLQKVVRQRRLKRQKSVWLLPEPETIPRLGGAFTGGGGGMIRYG
jgi:hypothetical protein